MPPARQGAPHGTSVCLEVRAAADVGQEGWMVPGKLWGPSPNTRCCLIPWGWRPSWPAGMGAPRVWCEGTAWGSNLSLPPSRPVWPSLGCGAGSGHRAAPRHQDPTGTLLLSPAACLRSSTQQGGDGSSPLWKRPGLGGVSVCRGPACSLGSCSRQLPCAQPLPHAVYGHFLNTVFILTSL